MTLVKSPSEIITERAVSNHMGLLSAAPEWERLRLGDLVDVLNGAPFDSQQFNTSGDGMPLIRIRDVVQGATSTFFSGEYEPKYVMANGDLLVGMDGDFNMAYWRSGPALLNQRVCRISSRDSRLSQEFLAYVLPGYLKAIWDETSATTVKHLSSKTLQEIPIPVPPLDEQQRIVEILDGHFSRLDAAERSLERAASQAAVFKSAVACRILSGSSEPHPDDHHIRIGTSTWVVPQDWTITTVGGIGRTVEFGTGAKSGPKVTESDVPVLRMGNIRDGAISWEGLKYLPHSHPDTAALSLQEGDLLFNRTNSMEQVGKAAVIERLTGVATFASYLIRVRVTDAVHPRWLSLLLNSAYGRSYMRSVATQQVGQANVNGTKLKAMPVAFPAFTKQERLLAEYEQQGQEAHRLRSGLLLTRDHGRALRRSLLHAAFTGQLTREFRND